MPGGLNRVMLLGDLAAEPEVYVTRSGQVVLTLRLGTTEAYVDKDEVRRERTCYHPVVVLGKRAEALSKVLHRGARVFVEGSLRSTPYQAREGATRMKTEVLAIEVFFAGETRDTRETRDPRETAAPPAPPAPPSASGLLPFR